MSRSNTTLTDDELDLVNQCARRLRLIQSDSSALQVEKRREYLREEIARSFKDAGAAGRERLMNALLSRFPVDGRVAMAATAAPASAPTPVDESPEALLERFLRSTANLPPAQKTEFAQKLSAGGFAWVDKAALELEMSDGLRQRLGLQAGEQPRLERIVELACLLVERFSELDRTALLTLKELYPRSTLLKRSHDFRFVTGQYLAGSREEIETQVRLVSALMGGMLAGMLGGGRDFGRQFVEKYSPAAIEEVIIAEGRAGFMGPGKKERCWDKYNNLSKDIATPELIDRLVKDSLGRFVDSRTKNS